MSVLRRALDRHWAALVALGAILLTTSAFADWESGTVSVDSTSPADGKVREAAFDVGPDGTSYAAWTHNIDGVSRLEVAVGHGTKFWPATPVDIRTAAPAGVSSLRMAAGRDAALLAFTVGDQTSEAVTALRLTRAGGVEGPFTLSGGASLGDFLDVGVADDGSGVVAWMTSTPAYDASGTSAGLRWDAHATAVGRAGAGRDQLLATGLLSQGISLAVAHDGRAAIAAALPGEEVSVGERKGGRIVVNEAPPEGEFGPPAAVPGPDGAPALGESAAVGYTRDRALRAVWVEHADAGVDAKWTLVSAIRYGASFEDRVKLGDDPLAGPIFIVPLDAGELVAWQHSRADGSIPQHESRLDIAGVAGDRVIKRASLRTTGDNPSGFPLVPSLERVGVDALALWEGPRVIGYAHCSLERGCDERRDIVKAGRGEQLKVAGAGVGALAWLEGRDLSQWDLHVGALPTNQ
jgi:hypothetical protein